MVLYVNIDWAIIFFANLLIVLQITNKILQTFIDNENLQHLEINLQQAAK